MRWPQTSQSGRGWLVEISERVFAQRSKERSVRRICSGWWVKNLRASVTCREAARFTAVERMPAVSQVSTLPVGAEGKMQERQEVAGDRG